jgi:hypothetical protein
MSPLQSIEEKLPAFMKHARFRWLAKYVGISVALMIVIVLVFQHVLGLDVLSYADPIGIAALLGLIGVIALGVALMGATFYSARSGMDEQAGEARIIEPDDEHDSHS